MIVTMRPRKGALALLLILAAGLAVAADGCSSSSGKGFLPGGGGIAPAAQSTLNVVSFSPPNGATGVPITAVVTVTFDEDVNPATLISANFIVSDLGGAIAGMISYDNPTRTAVFVPTVKLPPASLITVNLVSDIRSTGNLLLKGGSFSFTTGTIADVDTTPPTFGGATAAVAVNGARITVSWTAATDDFDPSSSISFWVYRTTTLGVYDFTAPIGVSGPGTTRFTDRELTPSTTYYYVVRAVDTSQKEDTNTNERTTSTLAPTSWMTDVYPLFTVAGPADCTMNGCHNAATNSGGLILTPIGVAFSELSLVSNLDGGCSTLRRVEPSDSVDSLLYRKLEGTQDCGGPMPQTGGVFTNAQLKIVNDWIEEGALNN